MQDDYNLADAFLRLRPIALSLSLPFSLSSAEIHTRECNLWKGDERTNFILSRNPRSFANPRIISD